MPAGSSHKRARAICGAYASGEKLEAIAATYGVTSARICQIARAAGLPRRGVKDIYRGDIGRSQMDFVTIVRAIDLVGSVTPAAMTLYEGFIASTSGNDQAELKRRYAAAREQSDALHGQLQAALGGQ